MLDPRRSIGPILCIVGARPNYMKMAPLMRVFRASDSLPPAILVHTGQHYDYALSDRLFADLRLPLPDVNLEVGSGSHAQQTAEVMKRFEPLLDEYAPSCVVVVGDVNSTLACSLVAVKRGVRVVHVEAGLRSFDRSMPEEINRLLTDQIADLLYTTERSAHENLRREGIEPARVVFVGNLMIDSLHAALPNAIAPADTLQRAQAGAPWMSDGARFGVVTLHRPSNVDDPQSLAEVLATLNEAAGRVPLIWPMHPRTRGSIERFGMSNVINRQRIVALPPQGYLEMVGLMNSATFVLTDSGGIQEETTALGVPCLTMRDNTERPITIEQGTNLLVGRDRQRVLAAVDEIVVSGGKRGRVPELWDGRTAERIAMHFEKWLGATMAAEARA